LMPDLPGNESPNRGELRDDEVTGHSKLKSNPPEVRAHGSPHGGKTGAIYPGAMLGLDPLNVYDRQPTPVTAIRNYIEDIQHLVEPTRHDTPATSRGVTIVARPKSLEVRTTPDLCTNSPLKERRWWEISDEASAHAFTPTYAIVSFFTSACINCGFRNAFLIQ
ncbi:hypothetical protein T4E_2368, partial [Trichinella pseudospiralis]